MKNKVRDLLNSGKILKDIARHPYAWPGGYLKVLVMNGSVLCGHCVKERFADELWTAHNICRDVGIIVYYEGLEYCEHCNRELANI